MSRSMLRFVSENIIIGFIAAVIARFVVFPILREYELFLLDYLIEAVVQIIIFFMFFLGAYGIRIFRLRRPLSVLLQITSLSKEASKEIAEFVQDSLGDIRDTISDLTKPEGVVLDRDKAELMYKLFFEHGGKNYVGTDSNIPSVFLTLYQGYLDAQAKYSDPTRSKRVLIVEQENLNRDYVINSRRFMNLWRWHIKEGAELLQVKPRIASDLAEKYGFWTQDVGIWEDKYALLFKPENGIEGLKIRLSLIGKGDERFKKVVSYFNDLLPDSFIFNAQARKLEFVPRTRGALVVPEEERRAISGFQSELARHWEEFVEPEKRIKTLKPFLEKILSNYPKARILDGATGIGCDSVELTNMGYYVISNEIDEELSYIAFENSSHSLPVTLRLTHYDWRTIGEDYPKDFPNQLFDVILVLGNSLCLVLDAEERKKCLIEFAKILNPGGTIVIDERNFPYMLKNAKKVTKLGGFPYKREVIYCGEIVQGRPIEVDPKKNLVIFEYTHKILGAVGTLKMYPFREGEMEKMLEETGFKVVKKYKDLKEKYDETPMGPPDFFTYVAIKQED